MKSVKVSFIVLIICLFAIIPLFFIKNGLSVDYDIEYEFSNFTKYQYNESEASFDYINYQNTTIYSEGLFNGTYSFTDETGLDESNLPFVDDYNLPADTSIEVISGYKGHNEVLQLDDQNGVGGVGFIYIYNEFESTKTSGSISFWVLDSDVTKMANIELMESTNSRIRIGIINDKIFWYVSGYNYISDAKDDNWYYFKIDFDCSADTFSLSINGTEFVSDESFTASTSLTQLRLGTLSSDSGYQCYYDAFEYSWYGYQDYRNFYCVTELSNEKVIYAETFEYNSDGTIVQESDSNINGWSENDYDNHIYGLDGGNYYITSTNVQTLSLYKDDFNSNENVSRFFEVAFGGLSPYDTYVDWYFKFYSYDNTCFLNLNIHCETGNYWLSYYDGSSYVDLFDIGASGYNSTLNITTYKTDYSMAIIEYRDCFNGINYFTIVPLLSNKIGFDKVSIESSDTNNDDSLTITHFIASMNGTYISGGWSIQNLDLGANMFTNYEIFNAIISGNFSLQFVDSGFTSYSFCSYGNHSFNNESYFIYNTWSPFTTNYFDMIFLLKSNDLSIFNITSFSIITPIMTDNINTYYPTLEYSNVDLNNSYFYVLNGKLYYYIEVNDSNTEYLQLNFDVIDFYSTDYSMSISSYKSNNYFYSIFELNYSDITTETIIFQNQHDSQYRDLSDLIQVSSISFIITDNDKISESSSCIGYFDSLSFEYSYTSFDFDYTDLFGILPIYCVWLFTIGIGYTEFKKESSKDKKDKAYKIIIPLSMVSLLLCFIATLIPLWTFGTCMVAHIFMILKKRGI